MLQAWTDSLATTLVKRRMLMQDYSYQQVRTQILVVKAFVEAPSSGCFFSLTFGFANAALKEFIRCVVPGNLQFRRVGGR